MRAVFSAEVRAIESEMEGQLRDAVLTLVDLDETVLHPTAEKGGWLAASGQALRQASRQTDLRLLTLSALQAPVACDLRLVLTMIQIAQHQMLIANQFTLISEQLIEIDSAVLDVCRTGLKVAEMARYTREQLDAAARAFAERDADVAGQLGAIDDRLDRLNRQICQASLEMRATADQRELALRHVLIARSLERIGDNAVNIASRTAQLVQSDVHRLAHPNAAPSLTPLA